MFDITNKMFNITTKCSIVWIKCLILRIKCSILRSNLFDVTNMFDFRNNMFDITSKMLDIQGGQNVQIVRIFVFCNPKTVRIVRIFFFKLCGFLPGNTPLFLKFLLISAKELSFCHKLWFSNLYILDLRYFKLLILKDKII